jgi:hypothetical protein
MTPLPIALKTLATAAMLLVLAGCQPSQTRAVPSVAQIGADLKCVNGDHGFEDLQAGWGFCYPGTWKYTEKSQGSQSPPGLDLTFDITNVPPTPVPCASPTTPSPTSPRPSSTPCSGQFAFMIISTYERGNATDLAGWAHANMPSTLTMDPITWGNAVQAYRLSDGRRIALTPHHVVIMDLHTGEGLLDLDTEMGSRLNTWVFSF